MQRRIPSTIEQANFLSRPPNFCIVLCRRLCDNDRGTAMPQDSEISWPVLRRIVQEWAGTSAELAEVSPLDGGCISTTVSLTLADRTRAVLKISAHRVDRSY